MSSCGGTSPRPPAVTTSGAEIADLETQIRTFCGHCHALPAPDTLPRSAWKEDVEQMYRFYGLANPPVKPPPIDAVIKSYEQGAPVELPDAVFDRASGPLPVTFAKTPLPALPDKAHPERPGSHVSNVSVACLSDPKRPEIIACEMSTGAVLALKPWEPAPAWRLLGRVAHPAHAEVVDLDNDGIKDLLIADLGNFLPTDRRGGSVVWLRGRPDGTYAPYTLLEGVGRVADVQAADFRGTGRNDLVVAVFGWRQTGEVLLLENETTDWDKPRFAPRVVDPRHGAIHVPVADLNGDGKPDFVALLAQEYETVVAYLNEGGGKFRPEVIFKAPHPGYGSSGIQLVDLDGDGDLDVLYTNGDTLDAPYILKPYHGIQWLENPGRGRFPWVHHHLTSMYGVHRAVAGDLDGDGDLDIVAVGYLPDGPFPQRAAKNLDAVIVLEQTAPGRFARHTLEATTCDHVTCALGDLFGTGRLDLVVGNFSAAKADHPVAVWKNLGRRK